MKNIVFLLVTNIFCKKYDNKITNKNIPVQRKAQPPVSIRWTAPFLLSFCPDYMSGVTGCCFTASRSANLYFTLPKLILFRSILRMRLSYIVRK